MKNKLISTIILGMLPVLASAGNFTPFADVLFWNASEQNSANWAITIGSGGSTNVGAEFPVFHYSPGVRAGLNYVPDNNSLDSTLTWTYFSTSTTSNIPVGRGVVTSGFFSSSYFISRDLFAGAYLDWQIVMNTVDFDVSHKFHPTSSLTLQPQLGVKAGTIYQTMNTNWNAIFYHATERSTNNFTGVGPTFGVGAKWNFFDNFNLSGNVTSALMWGKWNNSDVYNRPSALLGLVTPTTVNIKMSDSKLGTLMMDYFVGVDWSHHGKSDIQLQLGYEMQYWANQLRMLNIGLVPTHGDLTIQGLTCGLSIAL